MKFQSIAMLTGFTVGLMVGAPGWSQETITVTNLGDSTAPTERAQVAQVYDGSQPAVAQVSQPVQVRQVVAVPVQQQTVAQTQYVQQPVQQYVQQPTQQIVKQPVTIVEAAPLTPSRAENLRKQREKSEVETEQKIVEQLEQSRIQDEQKRQDAILGSFGAPAAAAVVVQQQPVQPVVYQQAPPTVVDVNATKSAIVNVNNMESVRAEVRDDLSNGEKAVILKRDKSYVRGSVGMIDYDSINVRTVGALGVSFGKIFDEHWSIDVEVMGSRSYISETAFLYRDLSQFNIGLGTKYEFMPDRIRPSVGFLLEYVNRSYSELLPPPYPCSGCQSYSDLSSWAIDYGFTAGVDFVFNRDLAVGFEYRYMMNMTYQMSDDIFNTPAYRNAYGPWTPIEERGSNYLGFSLRYMF